ncbi:MAG: type II and III secretion system protein [Armatimonadota bacterium]
MFIWFYSAMPLKGLDPRFLQGLLAKQPAVSRKTGAPKATQSKFKGQPQPYLVSKYQSHIRLLDNSPFKSHTFDFMPQLVQSSLDITEPNTPAAIQTAAATFAPEAPQPVLPWTQKLVNLNLSATAIETVVSVISKQTGANVVLLSKPNQKVTINVSQMPISEALKHLAMLAGLRTIRVKNAVVMADEVTLKGAYPKEYDLEYGNVVKPEVPDSTKTNGTSNPVPPTPAVEEAVKRIHTLKYQGAVQVVNALKEYFATLKVNVVALPNTLLPNLGASGGASGLSSSTSSSTATSTVESRAKQVLLTGPIAAVQDAILTLQLMDIPRKQVEITVTVHDVSNDALRDAGVTWDLGQTTLTEAVNGNANVGTFSRTGLSFVGTIHALEQASKAKLLASPNISVMDGELGSILIGEKRRFPVVTGTTSNGQFIYSTEEQNVGISLLVATDISEDGTVSLALNAQVSSILGFLQLNGGSYPQIATRETKSMLHLKDGQTMLMGGLLRDEEIVNLQKVPYLSQIPFFGELFKSRKTQKNASQLLISITPHIIKQ